jgi:hypothetical protein
LQWDEEKKLDKLKSTYKKKEKELKKLEKKSASPLEKSATDMDKFLYQIVQSLLEPLSKTRNTGNVLNLIFIKLTAALKASQKVDWERSMDISADFTKAQLHNININTQNADETFKAKKLEAIRKNIGTILSKVSYSGVNSRSLSLLKKGVRFNFGGIASKALDGLINALSAEIAKKLMGIVDDNSHGFDFSWLKILFGEDKLFLGLNEATMRSLPKERVQEIVKIALLTLFDILAEALANNSDWDLAVNYRAPDDQKSMPDDLQENFKDFIDAFQGTLGAVMKSKAGQDSIVGIAHTKPESSDNILKGLFNYILDTGPKLGLPFVTVIDLKEVVPVLATYLGKLAERR